MEGFGPDERSLFQAFIVAWVLGEKSTRKKTGGD